ncbi:Transposase [Lentzea waywayandensis]|uniref:Transposase n=1 Tax=Lentzea waywayandensis TaxID=84724 RepID=A0A1I6D3P1_9PSEU|nr:Transposase [Lentzea waywayandensis]
MLYVPGRLVNRMAGTFPGEGKTDAKDARTIAETARLRGDLTAVAGPDDIVAELRILTARLEELMEDWVRGSTGCVSWLARSSLIWNVLSTTPLVRR